MSTKNHNQVFRNHVRIKNVDLNDLIFVFCSEKMPICVWYAIY